MRIRELFQESVSPRKKITKQDIDAAFGIPEDKLRWKKRIDFLSLIDNDNHNLLGYIPLGIYLGYSNESIVEFIKRAKDFYKGIVPKPTNTPFDGTGFIPSKRERKQPPSKVIDQINKRRMYEMPFSIETAIDDEPEWLIKEMEIRHLLKTNEKFQQRVLTAMRLVKKRHPALYGDLPI